MFYFFIFHPYSYNWQFNIPLHLIKFNLNISFYQNELFKVSVLYLLVIQQKETSIKFYLSSHINKFLRRSQEAQGFIKQLKKPL